LGVGRLNRQKGFDLLIGAFHRISDSFPEWDLTILGEGAERANLEALVARLGLGQRVRMPGREADPFPYYRGADVFVLSSRFEGFPGVLVEAMGMGAPVIAAACTGAVTEILEGGRSGLLVEPNSTASLALALERLMGDSAERARLADAGRSVRQRYAPDRILDQWEELFRELVSNP
jgi:glycosyltransferase involved in cell wall biosynthesis